MASWFVTPAAIECMGCQVAVELHENIHENNEQQLNTNRNNMSVVETTSVAAVVSNLDWQLRRLDPMTLVRVKIFFFLSFFCLVSVLFFFFCSSCSSVSFLFLVFFSFFCFFSSRF